MFESTPPAAQDDPYFMSDGLKSAIGADPSIKAATVTTPTSNPSAVPKDYASSQVVPFAAVTPRASMHVPPPHKELYV